jgi:ABC-2 type transport system ATP-binding protein
MTLPISIQQLSKRYRSGFLIREIRALESVTFDVQPGEIFGFLGPNGAGKTTAIKILMGLMRPTSGAATVLGERPDSAKAKNRVGFLPESPYFYEHLSAREILELSARLHGIRGPARKERIDRMLTTVGLAGAQKGRLGKFSRGMLQRVGIAQALLHEPELVVLDEPMGGLDPIGRKEFRDIIVGLRARGRTVFFSTHILQDVELICDRVAILVGGRLVSLGRLDEIVTRGIEDIELAVRNITAPAIQASGVAVRQVLPGEDQLMIVVANEADAQQMLKYVLAQGGRLVSMTPRTRTLEDYFMSQVAKETVARDATPVTPRTPDDGPRTTV